MRRTACCGRREARAMGRNADRNEAEGARREAMFSRTPNGYLACLLNMMVMIFKVVLCLVRLSAEQPQPDLRLAAGRESLAASVPSP